MKQPDRLTSNLFAVPKRIYLGVMILLGLTGFGQMPIYSRYYMADIPGFAWLGEFLVTHYVHYLTAIALLGLAGWIAGGFLLRYRKHFLLTLSGWTSLVLIAGIAVTGLMLVIRNLSGVILPPGFIVFLDVAHLVLVMILMFKGLGALVLGKKWTRPVQTV